VGFGVSFKKFLLFLFVYLGLGTFLNKTFAMDVECYMSDKCNNRIGRSSSGNPSTGAQVKINPSAVPTEEGYGIEALLYRDQVDLSLVRGTGRVGAAISPSNSEETFFGPPGFENSSDLQQRKYDSQKYPNQKYTLAAAANIYDNKKSGLKTFNLKLGAMAKYNKLTKGFRGGGGLNGVLGPFTFGASAYNDQTQLNDFDLGEDLQTRINYKVQTYNVGLFLSSIVLDYSHLKLTLMDDTYPSEISLFTISFLIQKIIIIAAKRTENSGRLSYNYDTKELEFKEIKEDYFGGVQFRVNKTLMLGAFYNYYLLREFSFSATLFF
jgi:hypothetical protein